MKKFLLILILITVSLINLNAEPKYIFKIASEAPDGTIWITAIKNLAAELAKRSNNEIAIKVYPGGIMGDQSSIIKKMKIGQLSGCTFSSFGLGLIYKDYAVMGFPTLFANYEEYDYVKEKMSDYFESEFEKRGFINLGWSEVGIIYLFSKKKINSVESLKESKPFLTEGDIISQELFNEIKATPVQIQISDVMTGLQAGLLDTVFSSPYTLIATQWFTRVNYMADFPITLMIGAVMVDKKIFTSMPIKYQDEMKKLFKDTFDKANAVIRENDKKALVTLKNNGLILLPVSQKDKNQFNEVCNNLAVKLTEKEYSRDVLNIIKKHVIDYRKNK